MNYNKFQIFEFNLRTMVKDPSIVMIAKRGSGKSYICRHIIYHYRHIPGGVVIAPTDKLNPFYKAFFPDLFIHYDVKDNVLKKILVRQIFMLQKQKEKLKKGLKIDPSAILIMDDCLARKKTWAKDENILEILMNGRHYRLTYILTMQTPLGITPDLRLNFDYIFLLKDDSTINKKKLWDNYASIFPSLASFEKAFSECTRDYKSMVIDNRKPSDKIQDKIFWFKAREQNFKFGSESFRFLDKKYYNPNHHMLAAMKMLNNDNLFVAKRNNVDIDIDLKKN